MSQINCSGHFIRSSRRSMTPPRSQIVLGTDNVITRIVPSEKSTTLSARCLQQQQHQQEAAATNNNVLTASKQIRRSQLESVMWSGESHLLSPATRDRIIKQDTALLLGGGQRRFAGQSNKSNPGYLFVNPGGDGSTAGNKMEANQDGAVAVAPPIDIRCHAAAAGARRRVAGVSAMANSAEFVQTSVGQCTVGSQLPPPPASAKNRSTVVGATGFGGVKKVPHESDHIDNCGYCVRPTPTRERTPPPPLPARKVKTSLRRVDSPLRSDSCSERWDRFGEDQFVARRQGQKMFPDKNQQTFGFSNTSPARSGIAALAAAASTASTETSSRGTTASRRESTLGGENVLIGGGSTRHRSGKGSYNSDSPHNGSSSLGAGSVPLTGSATTAFASSKKILSSKANNSQNISGLLLLSSSQSRLNVQSSGGGGGGSGGSDVNVRYVARKKVSSSSAASTSSFNASSAAMQTSF